MAKTKKWDKITLEDVLRVDSFGQQITLLSSSARGQHSPMVADNREFFTQIYSELDNDVLEIIDGSQFTHRTVRVEEWLENEISNTENSLVIFIEGYAGCGKSIFVQYLLSRQLKSYEYEYSYYNYDIGAYYNNEDSHRIAGSIKACFTQQLMKCFEDDEMSVFQCFKKLLAQEAIRYVDSTYSIYNDFANTRTFKDEIVSYTDKRDDSEFREVMHSLLKDFNCEQILALDYVFRLAKYIASTDHSRSTLYVCYDNMDAIEDFDELNKFDNTLASLRKNIDDYINNTYANYEDIPVPCFVIMATYRKITAAKVELSAYSERLDDYAEYNSYIHYVDASHIYSYYNIIAKRNQYFSSYIKRRKLNNRKLSEQLAMTRVITETEFVHNKYAGLWNNNYRTCSTILYKIFTTHYSEIKECERFINLRIDGYDEENVAYFGASAIFLSLVCKIFNEGGLWGSNHMNLVPLNINEKDKLINQRTSLSRLLLTYISNVRDEDGNKRAVSTKEIFDEFADLFSVDEICKCLSNMLARDKMDTWRRPIYYHRNALSDNENMEKALKRQWKESVSLSNDSAPMYTELLLCECGNAYIERITSEFEFFSNRISNKNRCIYCLENIGEIENIIKCVYSSVEICCKDMIAFGDMYMKKKGIKSYTKYIGRSIHPRTFWGKPQLHTERVIFSHVSYLNGCRLFHIEYAKEFSEKKNINNMFVMYIEKYLMLYMEYILSINADRKGVAEELLEIIKCIKKEKKDEDIMFQSISRHK